MHHPSCEPDTDVTTRTSPTLQEDVPDTDVAARTSPPLEEQILQDVEEGDQPARQELKQSTDESMDASSRSQQLKQFFVDDESFDCMLSYRVRTEGGKGGNDFADDLRKELLEISRSEVRIPDRGPWPKFAKSSKGTDKQIAKVYLDAAALKDGEQWEAGSTGLGGFLGGVVFSVVFVPLLSAREIKGRLEGSLGGMVHLQPQEGVDYKDNVLLEFTLALEMAHDKRTATQAIFPIFVSEKDDSDGRYKKFDFGFLSRLSESPSQKTNDAAAVIMERLGFSQQRIAVMRARSVKGTVNEILKFQGMSLSDEGIHKKALRAAAHRVADKIVECVENLRSQGMVHFRMSKPQAEEVLDWLRDHGLASYNRIFARHGLDSLLLITSLTPDNIDQLTREHAAMFGRDGTELLVGSRAFLAQAVEVLRSDPRAKAISERLQNYFDPEVSGIAAAFKPNIVEICFSKTKLRWAVVLLGVLLLASAGVHARMVWWQARMSRERFRFWDPLVHGTDFVCDEHYYDDDGHYGGYYFGEDYEYRDYCEMPPDVGLMYQFMAGQAVIFFVWGCSVLYITLSVAPRRGPLAAKWLLELSLVVASVLGIASALLQHFLCKAEELGVFFYPFCSTRLIYWAEVRAGERYDYTGFEWPAWILVLVLLQRIRPEWTVTFMFLSVGLLCVCFGVTVMVIPEQLKMLAWTGSIMMVAGLCVIGFWAFTFGFFVHAGRKARQLDMRDYPEYQAAWQQALKGSEEQEVAAVGSKQGGRARVHPEEQRRPSAEADGAVREMATMAAEVTAELQRQSYAAQRASGLACRALEHLRLLRASRAVLGLKRSGRFYGSGRSTRVVQGTPDIDRLYLQARTINDHFQALIASLVQESAGSEAELSIEAIPGPVKQPERALQKCVRLYRRDPSCLSDLVRCTVVVQRLEDARRFLGLVKQLSVIGLAPAPMEEDGLQPRKIFRIMRFFNRLDPDYNAQQKSAGYRDVSLNLEMGWCDVTGPEQEFRFEPVGQWEKLRCHRHVCEVQLLLKSMQDLKVKLHQHYTERRNILAE